MRGKIHYTVVWEEPLTKHTILLTLLFLAIQHKGKTRHHRRKENLSNQSQQQPTCPSVALHLEMSCYQAVRIQRIRLEGKLSHTKHYGREQHLFGAAQHSTQQSLMDLSQRLT